MLIIIGEWNIGAWNKAETNAGKFGLGDRNEVAERLIELCKAINLFIANTCFKQLNRWLYT